MNPQSVVTGVTSPSLLLRVKRHEPEAWSRLSRLYGPLVYKWSRQCGLGDADAADIVQETFGVLAKRIDGFRRERPGDTFRGWLWTVARNKIRDQARRAKDRAAASGGSTAYQNLQQLADDAPEPGGDDSQSVTERGITARALGLLQAEFEPSTWQAFWQAAVEGHTAAEIGARLGITKHAVHQAKYRVLRRLREELDGLA